VFDVIWSPDGNHIAFAAGRSSANGTLSTTMMVTTPAGAPAQTLFTSSGSGTASWAADSHRLVIDFAPSQQAGMAVVSLSGAVEQRLPAGGTRVGSGPIHETLLAGTGWSETTEESSPSVRSDSMVQPAA
jgi:hypothetical protein